MYIDNFDFVGSENKKQWMLLIDTVNKLYRKKIKCSSKNLNELWVWCAIKTTNAFIHVGKM